ncbi:ABC transporter ATP-binding protein [Pallidibacillus thermolactis]|uniref:ABC transporter ATP-binding protein n=1 Tax=Pallidibacillus thermolactis TaxID=251051 RepID=UPI0021D80C73|nr:ABC transporter ATP-binding protein [Pallidibacillus thermolactis]MCU9601326.1 ABC transporter ATP-binding protein [Pallidibacillus thermolactis subsp. kokeshiiformis]
MKPIIELRNVSKKIRNKQIIDNLSFEVMAGEVLGFLGPNGAGKTTTIRMITGLMKVSSGEIIINGTNLKQDFEKAISQIGAIVENPELYKFLTGYENLMQAARLYKGVTKEKINQVVEMVGLKDHIHNKVKTYSLGMRQRLGIALCLLHDPKVLILDEPTNGLDPAGIKEIRHYLRKLAHENNLAILVSSHLLSEMEMMCDRIAIIQNGKLVNIQRVKEEEVKTRPYFIQVDEITSALNILQDAGYKANPHEYGIVVYLEKKQVPEIIQQFVQQNILIYEVKVISKSLEDRFLEITNDKAVTSHA